MFDIDAIVEEINNPKPYWHYRGGHPFVRWPDGTISVVFQPRLPYVHGEIVYEEIIKEKEDENDTP